MPSRGAVIARTFVRRWSRALLSCRLGFVRSPVRRATFAAETRRALEELGPAFIKLGQLVSVRPDVFSAELVFELAQLCDDVPAVPFERILRVIEREFGRPVEEVFQEFEREPIASASIAQVHGARLRRDARPAWGEPLFAGQRVAVKVVRPGVHEAIKGDLAWARRLASRTRWVPFMRRLDLAALLDEFERTSDVETDMRREGRVADRFAFDFRSDPHVLVPRIAWSLTTRQVLTMEYVDGWRLSELDEAARAGIDGEGLALHGARAFMRQVLVHGRFHADLHPANLLVTPDGCIAYLDFGIVGQLDRSERSRVAGVLAAIVERDSARALDESAALGLHVRPEHRGILERDLDALMERTLAHERDVRHFGIGLLSLLARHHVRVPVGYGLLVKALVTVEGVARSLYPQIDIVDSARPFTTALQAPSKIYSSVSAALRLPVR